MWAFLSAVGLFHMTSDFRTHVEGLWDMMIFWEEKNGRTGGSMHCLCLHVCILYSPYFIAQSRSQHQGQNQLGIYSSYRQGVGKETKYLLNSKAFSKPILLAGWGCSYIFVYICLKEYNNLSMLGEL